MGVRIASGGSSPTANLDRVDVLIPADGVYAARAFLPDGSPPLSAACHVGPNVTFGALVRTVEAHLIGFDGDLYGQSIELDFLELLRPSRKFAGLEELLTQVRGDVERARAVCSLADVS